MSEGLESEVQENGAPNSEVANPDVPEPAAADLDSAKVVDADVVDAEFVDADAVDADVVDADQEPILAVVGVGASAGGLEPLRTLLASAKPDTPAAYVIIQHLDPDHESLMVDVLSRGSALPVHPIQDGLRPESGHVYVIPPNKYLTLEGGRLRLYPPSDRRGWRMAVDHFFRSLASDAGERSVAIVLSGTGTDGTVGVRAVKEAGGMVMVQDPEEAGHDGMPRSAIATGVVDYVVSAAQMQGILDAYLRHPYVARLEPVVADEEIDILDAILAALLEATHHDFRPYKKATIKRRIQRRMGLRYMEEIADYLAFIREHPEETTALYRDLLIGVTEFFRGPEAFEVLEKQVIPEILAGKLEGEIRVWVPGCSTGEEAYSLAMVLMDALGASRKPYKLQVFATDIDNNALDFARTGLYPKSALSEVAPERVRTYFKVEGEQLLVKKDLREAVVFAVQNLIADPPFSRLDLISCRNLMIYLEPRVQASLIQMFHFALQKGGFLVLGGSENIGQHSDLFEPVSKKWRIYRRLETGRYEHFQLPVSAAHERRRIERPRETVNITVAAERQLLRRHAPAAVLVDRNGEILHVSGDTSPYLILPQGPPKVELLELARDSIRGRLRAALHRATHGDEPVTTSARLDGLGEVHITIEPLADAESSGVRLVVFQPRFEHLPGGPTDASGGDGSGGESDSRGFVRELERELADTKRDLQSTIEELELSNQELRASNEEIMSMNEELQSTNEELETSQEELQSLNEELITLNNQLQDKVNELEEANNDIANLLTSTELATLFVGTGLEIKRYTPNIRGLFEMRPSDIGRPLTDIAPQFEDPSLVEDIHAVLADHAAHTAEVFGRLTERNYLRRAVPYRTENGEVDGAVVTFADITELKHAADLIELARRDLEVRVAERTAELREEKHRLQSVLQTASDAILTIDQTGTIELVNSATEVMFGYTAAELLGQNVRMLMPAPYAEEHAGYVRRYLGTGEARMIGRGREVAARHKDGHVFPIELSVGEDGQGANGRRFTGIIRDLTQRKLLEDEFRQAQKLETLGRLSGGIAHDFNNLLMGIMSSADLVLRKLEIEHPARGFAEAIKREAVRGSSLTRQLLSFSRKREARVETLEIDDVVAAFQPMLAPILGSEVELLTRLEGGGARVLADRGHLEQILANLVSNARDAITGKGTIEISVTRQQFDAAAARGRGILPGRYLELAVQDTGCGMDDATREKALEPFFTTKDEGEGTGLGLSTVYAMVEQARGQLAIDSTPGEGTTMRILLPEFDDAQEGSLPGGDETILLVEDEPLVRDGIQNNLERVGYQVLVASDGESALQLIEDGAKVDLLLSDIVLPGRLNGGELGSRLASRGVRAVFMSAFPEAKLRREGRVPEGARTLHKPFDEVQLLRSVRVALDCPAEEHEQVQALQPARILIVEDNAVTRMAYAELLGEFGHEVLEAGDGGKARALAGSNRLDLLICDLGLPDEPGTRLVADLRVLFPEIAVLFVTGRPADDPALVAALDKPRVKVLSKPVDLDELARAISGLLRR